MPVPAATGFIAAAGTAASATAAGLTLAAAQVAIKASFAYTAISAFVLQRLSRRRFQGTRARSPTTLRSEPTQARWVLGQCRTNGVWAWDAEEGKTYHQVQLISETPCDGLETMYINDEEAPLTVDPDDPNLYTCTAGRFAGMVTVRTYFAADGTEGAEVRSIARRLANALPWTTEHRLQYISYVLVSLTQNDYQDGEAERLFTGIPNLEYVVRGIKFAVPDEQGAPGPVEWTANAAKLRYWWLSVRRDVPDAEIDLSYLHASIAVSDERVTDDPDALEPVTSARYEYNGVIESGENPATVEEEMNEAINGHCPLWDGQYLIRAGAERAATTDIVGDDIIAEPVVAAVPDFSDRTNEITVSLSQSWRDDYLPTTLTVTDSEAQAADGQVLSQNDLSMRFVTDPVQARNIATGLLAEARAALRVELRTKPRPDWSLLTLKPGDKATLTLPDHGFQAREFLVVSNRVQEDWSVTLGLQDWPADRFADRLEPYAARPRLIVPPARPPAPAELTATAEPRVDRNAAGWRIRVAWADSPFETRVRIEGPERTVIDTRDSSAVWETSSRGLYAITARHRAPGAPESLATATTLAVDPSPILNPTGTVSVTAIGNVVQIRVPVVQLNIVGAILRQFHSPFGQADPPLVTDANWTTANPVSELATLPISASPTSPFGTLGVTASVGRSGVYSFGLRLVDNFGQHTNTITIGLVSLGVQQQGSWTKEYAPEFRSPLDTVGITVGVWGVPRGTPPMALPFDAYYDQTTRDWWNGTATWPFCPNFPTDTILETLNFGQRYDNIQVTVTWDQFEPPGVTGGSIRVRLADSLTTYHDYNSSGDSNTFSGVTFVEPQLQMSGSIGLTSLRLLAHTI